MGLQDLVLVARVDHKGTQRNLWADGTVLYLYGSDSYTTLYICQNSQNFINKGELYCI